MLRTSFPDPISAMNARNRPTESQIRWLAGVLGKELWEQLATDAEFQSAVADSMEAARRVGLRKLAERERLQMSGAGDW